MWRSTRLRISGNGEGWLQILVPSSSSPSSCIRWQQCRQLGSKRRRNVPPKLKPTRKDRIRRLETITPSASSFSRTLFDRAETRLITAHNYVMSYWNPERYKPKQLPDGTLQPARPPRMGPNMDRRWWFWNILFALSPAMLLTAWAELYMKPKMKAAFIKAEVDKRKLVFGPDYVPKEGEIQYPYEDLPILDKLQKAFHDLSLWYLGIDLSWLREAEKIDDKAAQESNPETSENKQSSTESLSQLPASQQLPAVSAAVGAAVSAAVGAAVGAAVSVKAQQQSPPVESDSQESISEENKDETWRWNELFARIKNIESRLEEQERSQQHMRDFQWHRMNQSNIQNRGEDQLIKHWEQQRGAREGQQQQKGAESDRKVDVPFFFKQQNIPPPLPPPPADGASSAIPASSSEDSSKTMYSHLQAAIWKGMRENLSAKKEAVEKYGVDIMDRAWGFWSRDDEDSNDKNASSDPEQTHHHVSDGNKESPEKKQPTASSIPHDSNQPSSRSGVSPGQEAPTATPSVAEQRSTESESTNDPIEDGSTNPIEHASTKSTKK